MADPNQRDLDIEDEGNEPGPEDQQDDIEEEQLEEENGVEDEMRGEEDAQADDQGEGEALAALEREFRITHSPETADTLIKVYKEVDDIESVRRIRESLLEFNTLSEDVWEEWILDEINTAKGNEEKKAVLKLFERALEDSLYFDVAKLATKYVKGLYSQGIVRRQGVEITIEKLISHFCHDFNRGSKFFKRLRKFHKERTDITNELERDKLIRKIYERQLELPLADINVTFGEYIDWEKNPEERQRLEAIYKKTYGEIDMYLDLEDKLAEPLESHDATKAREVLKEFINNDKLKFEKKMNYIERILEVMPTEPQIWEEYIDLADKNIRSTIALERIYRRAAKNCPDKIDFAKGYLRALEKVGTEPEKIKEKMLAMLWNFTSNYEFYLLRLQLCEVYVRAMNTKVTEAKGDLTQAREEIIRFRQAIQEAIEFFSSDKSEENQMYISNIWLFKANVETYTLKDKKEMNVIMEKYVQANGSQYNAWNQYITFEQALGRPSTVRPILKRACEYTKDDIHSIYSFAVEYERKFGSLEDLENIERRYKEKSAKLAEENPAGTGQQANFVMPPPAAKDFSKPKPKAKKPQLDERKNKRKLDDEKPKKSMRIDLTGIKPSAKKVKKNEEEEAVPTEEAKTDKKEEDQEMKEEKKAREQEKPMEEEKQGGEEGKTENVHREPIVYPEYLDNKNTVFVKGFPISFGENDVTSIFPNADKVTGCRLVRDKAGKSKGLAYIDFQSQEEAQEACKSNGIVIDGRSLLVAFSDPPKKGKDDKKSLFINNLPFNITREMLESAFEAWKNHIMDIRIPVEPNGRAKGFAYMTFDSDEQANDAVEKNRDLHINGRKIKVDHADSKRHHDQILKALNVAFLKNLNFKATDEDILAYFSDYSIKKLHLVKDNRGKSKGFAYIEFYTSEDLRRALSIPEPTLMGRKFEIARSDRPITEEHSVKQKDAKNKKGGALSKKDAQNEGESGAPKKADQDVKDKKETKAVEAKTVETKEAPNQTMKSNDFFKNLFNKKK